MALAIFLWLFGLAVFGIGIWFLAKGEGFGAVGFSGILMLALITFWAAPMEFPSGLPMKSIGSGEYKVAFVYVAGENVNVGVEKRGAEKSDPERLYLYQFPESAFETPINVGAKGLIVVESGGFKKLILK